MPRKIKTNSQSARGGKKILVLCFAFIFYAGLFFNLHIENKAAQAEEIKTSGATMASRVAPGEFLPISVKLINFGSNKEIDVTVDYQVEDMAGNVVLSETETVAVQTTASFIKNIQIPHNFPSGQYRAISKIEYAGQEVPAVSNFQFTVEKKIAGIFASRFILYSIITLVVAIIFVIASRLLIKRRISRKDVYEYKEVPKDTRVFYELISDMILQMRQHEGDEAIEIAKNIDGLKIDELSGKVLKIDKDPAEIVALLMLYYQKKFGKSIDYSNSKTSEKNNNSIERNIEMIKKYFK